MEASVISMTALVTDLIGYLVVGVLSIAGAALGIYAVRFGVRKFKSLLSAGS